MPYLSGLHSLDKEGEFSRSKVISRETVNDSRDKKILHGLFGDGGSALELGFSHWKRGIAPFLH
jgi:hypothetical protein